MASDQEKVFVDDPELWRQFEDITKHVINMDAATALAVAKKMGYTKLVTWIEGNNIAYRQAAKSGMQIPKVHVTQ